jgi:hypothetical protein
MKILLMLSFLFAGCSSITKDGILVPTEKGYYVPELNGRAFPPVRRQDGHLLFDQDEATKEFKALRSDKEYQKRIPTPCSNPLRVAEQFHELRKSLEEKLLPQAQKTILELERQCAALEKISHLEYLKAYLAKLENRPEAVKEHLERFLRVAERAWPQNFFQEDTPGEEIEYYQKLRQSAQGHLEHGEELNLIKVEQKLLIPRHRADHWYEPGYLNSSDDAIRALVIITGNQYESGVSGFYDFKTSYGSFIPRVMYMSLSGAYYDLIYRKDITQSLDRRHQTGINLSLSNIKKVTYRSSLLSGTKANVEEEYIGFTAGYGGTYHFSENLSGLYQGRVVNLFTPLSGFDYTMLAKYRLFPKLNVHGGILDSHGVVGIDFFMIYFYYNTARNSLHFNLRGLKF